MDTYKNKLTRVYVCGPYSGPDVLTVLKNIGKGQQACARLFAAGLAPFCPWADRSFVMDRPDDNFTIQQFYDYSMAWLEVSDCVLALPGWEQSDGTKGEIFRAGELDIPVFFDENELLEWARRQK